MAYPTILINYDLGGAAASGAGPVAAVTGTKARTRDAATPRVGLFEASAPDLSLVATDGTHAAWIETGSGRRWSKIIGKKETAQADHGDIETGQVILSNLTSTAGMAANDPIMVVGAGAASADLYTEIYTVDSATQVSLKEGAGTTVVAADTLDPEHLILEDNFTITSDLAWAVGGYLSSAIERIFRYDVKPGWTIELQGASEAYDVAASLILEQSGTTALGSIKIKCTGNAKLATTTSIPYFLLRGDLYQLEALSADATLPPSWLVEVDSSVPRGVIYRDFDVEDTDGIHYTGAATNGRAIILGGSYHDGQVIHVDGQLDGVVVQGVYAEDPGTYSHTAIEVAGATPVYCTDSIFYLMLCGIDLGGTAGEAAPSIIERCMFPECTYYSIRATHVDRAKGLIVRNCLLHAATYTIDLATGSDYVIGEVDYNAHMGDYLLNNCPQGVHSFLVDADSTLVFRGGTAQDFRSNLVTLGAKGWPILVGATPMDLDVGAQMEKTSMGGQQFEVMSVSSSGENYLITIKEVLAGNYHEVLLAKINIPADSQWREQCVAEQVASFLRDNDPSAATGEELTA